MKKELYLSSEERKHPKRQQMLRDSIEIYSPKQITIERTANVIVDAKVEINLPDKIIGLLISVPNNETFKLQSQKTIKMKEKIKCNFLNTPLNE